MVEEKTTGSDTAKLMEERHMTKLNIGCGIRHLKGYKTIDIEPKNNPDIVGDFRTMKFEDVDEIRAEHILEHFSREEGLQVLAQWVSWLKEGGKLIVETPDIEYICKDWQIDPYWMTRHIYGSQRADWAFHKDGWYEGKFRQELWKLGMDVFSVQRNVSRKLLPNIKVVAIKGYGI
jgi:hypothetical protein